MDLNDHTLAKRILAIFLALVLVIGISAATSFAVSKNKIKKVQQTLQETIRENLEEYLADYTLPSKSNEGVITLGGEEPSELTQEQIDAIVEAVSSTIEYSLIKDAISEYSSVSEQSIATLNAKIDAEISKALNSNEATNSMSSSEKEALVNTITTMVKHDILEVLKEYGNGNANDIQTFKDSINKDIANLKTSISEYDKKFAIIESKLQDITKPTNNTSTEEIAKLTQEYKTLAIEVANINQAIKKMGDGSEIKAELTQSLNSLSIELNDKITANTEKINALEEALHTKDQQMESNIQQIIEDIQQINTILTGNSNGGVAKITYDASTNTLIISDIGTETGN